jgi:molybdenum cofactor biosynthesis protein B
MGVREHRQRAKGVGIACCAVLTVSDTREKTTDETGAYICETLREKGYRVVAYEIVRDDIEEIRGAVRGFAARNVRVVFASGGTGIGARDVTCEALEPLLEKRLEGFGELFRWLSYREVGAAAMLTRAFAGVTAERMLVFALPGSLHAVKLAMKLIMPELAHIVYETTAARGSGARE